MPAIDFEPEARIDFEPEAKPQIDFEPEGASVSQMAAATRATVGVVGRAVAARDFAVAGYDAPDRSQLEDGYQPDESSLMPRPEGPKAIRLLPALAANFGKVKSLLFQHVTAQEVSDALSMLASGSPDLTEEEAQAVIDHTTKPGNLEKIVAGAQRAAISVPESFTTPLGVATMGAGAIPGTAGRIVAGAFAVDMASQIPEQISQLKDAIASGDSERITEVSGNLLATGVMTAATAKHALTKPKTPLETVAPLTAEAVAKVAPIETKAAEPLIAQPEIKVSDIPLTTEAVAKVVEKEPVLQTPTPAPAMAAGESGKPPVTAGVPPAETSVTPEVPITKPEGERPLTTEPIANSRLAAEFPIQEPYSDKFAVSLQVNTTSPSVSDAGVIASLPEALRGSVDSVRRFQGEAVPTNKAASIPGRIELVFKDKASAQTAVDYFKGQSSAEIGSRGPGGAATGEPGTYDPASELTDALKTINELDPAKRASDSTRIADLWAAGKSTVEKAWGKVIAAKESLKSNLLTLPEVTPLKKLVGVIDSQLQSSSARSEMLGKAFEAAHPSKVRRGGIAIMVDSGMDVERVMTAISELPANTPRKIRQAFEAAASLTQKEMDAAQRIKGYFDQRLKDAQDAGVLKNFLEDYYTHVWKNTDSMPASLKGAMNSGQVVSYFENARQRKLETFIEGVKLGLEPVLDPSLVLPRYNYNLDRAIASRAFIKKLTGIKEADGRPTAAPTGSASKIENETGGTDATLIKPSTKSGETGDYKTVDNAALKGWKWVEKDSEGNPIMVQGDLAIHPDAVERIKNMMDKARLTPTTSVRIAMAVGAEVKGAKLGILSPFHQIHVGSHALWHLVNPFNLKPEIDWTLPSTKFATESGLKLAGDFHDRIGFSEGIGPGLIAQKLVPYARAYSEYLFKSFIPRLKLKTFEAVYQRDLKRYAGKASPDQIAARSADAVNSAYGELNRKWLGEDGRDPRLQRALQVGLLAPDFLEARGRFVAKAFTKFGAEERMALFVMGATLYTTARVLNQLLDGDPHADELGMMFRVRQNGRNYGVRSVLGDTEHLLSDWRSFVAHRINPFTTRTAVEAISGRELRTGLKRDTQQQVEDLLRQITPAQMDSMLPGDRAWYEGLTQSLGVTSQHQPTPAEIKKREAKAAKDAKNPPAFEFIYNPAHVKKGGAKK